MTAMEFVFASRGDVEFVVGHLLDGSIRQALVGLEGVDDGCHEFGGDVHTVTRPPPRPSRTQGVPPKRFFVNNYRSISPITMSSEPTIAGTSAIRQPRHSSWVTERLQKQLLRARTRQGIESPSLTM